MSKKSNLPAIERAAREAGLVAKQISKLEAEAHRVIGESRAPYSLQLVAGAHGISAVIRSDAVTIQIENGAVAVTMAKGGGDD